MTAKHLTLSMPRELLSPTALSASKWPPLICGSNLCDLCGQFLLMKRVDGVESYRSVNWIHTWVTQPYLPLKAGTGLENYFCLWKALLACTVGLPSCPSALSSSLNLSLSFSQHSFPCLHFCLIMYLRSKLSLTYSPHPSFIFHLCLTVTRILHPTSYKAIFVGRTPSIPQPTSAAATRIPARSYESDAIFASPIYFFCFALKEIIILKKKIQQPDFRHLFLPGCLEVGNASFGMGEQNCEVDERWRVWWCDAALPGHAVVGSLPQQRDETGCHAARDLSASVITAHEGVWWKGRCNSLHDHSSRPPQITARGEGEKGWGGSRKGMRIGYRREGTLQFYLYPDITFLPATVFNDPVFDRCGVDFVHTVSPHG